MTSVQLTDRDRRTLSIGVLAISTMLVAFRGAPALGAWESARMERARAAAAGLTSVRAKIAILPALRDSVRATRARLAAFESTLLTGATPAAIGAALASTVEDMADEHSVKVMSLQLRTDSSAVADVARAEVRITGIADIVGLAGFLTEIEGGATPLVVRAISVSQSEPAASDSKPEALHVDIMVAAIGMIGHAAESVRE